MPDIKRTLTYRRAIWTSRTANRKLEDYVRLIHQRLKTTETRTFEYSEGQIQGLAWQPRNGLVLVHVAQYVPRGSTSLVPLPSTEPASDTRELAPPGNTNFLRGDIMFLVAGDHLLMCPSGAREAVIGAYLESASEKLDLGSWAAQCSLEPVADISKIRLIRTEGVKKFASMPRCMKQPWPTRKPERGKLYTDLSWDSLVNQFATSSEMIRG